jgi:copper homeostasis protein
VGTLQAVNIPTHVMIRPRSGDFAYSSDEFIEMLKSIELVKASGAAGVVFGILLANTKQIDVERMR